MSGFLREHEFSLDFSGSTLLVTYEVCHRDGKAVSVAARRYFDEMGRLEREVGVIAVRDAGSPTRPTVRKSALVVRQLNDLIPIPPDAGRLLGFLQASGGRSPCYVFEGPVSALHADKSGEGTTSPPPERAVATPADRADEGSCPCVVDGPSAHSPAAAESTAEEEPQPEWW